MSAHDLDFELELFQHAHHWKNYWFAQLRPYLRGRVLEVGAGIGANIGRIAELSEVTSGVALEPSASLFKVGSEKVQNPKIQWVSGTTADLPEGSSFDTIVYIDVLEHIEDDRGELARAAARLNPGGHLFVLSPALPMLMSEFDRAVGHYRRYLAGDLKAMTPPGLELKALSYLDSLGLFLSLGNRLILKSASPKLAQVLFWDRWVVPVSRVLDPVLGRKVGKTVIAVWQRPA